jgi:hypothetical protein
MTLTVMKKLSTCFQSTCRDKKENTTRFTQAAKTEGQDTVNNDFVSAGSTDGEWLG